MTRATALLIPLLFTCRAAAAPDEETREAWIDFFRENARPLESPADLQPLIDAARGKKLVLLGESTHGTKEYYDWRFEISRRLIEEQDFNFIAVEGDWEALYALNRYVKDLPGAARSARDALVKLDRWPEWMWGNRSVEKMGEWLRSFNAKRPPERRVGIYGVDVYGWGASVRLLPDYLEKLEPGWGEEARSALEPLARVDGDPQKFRHKIDWGPDSSVVLHDIIDRLQRNRGEYTKRDPEAYLKARQSVKAIRQAKLHLRGSFAGTRDGWNERAVNFVDAVQRLFDHYGRSSRGILWAHNTHIGDARYTPARDEGTINSGQLARQRLGEKSVLLVGFATRGGRVLAGSSWGSPVETMTMPSADPASFEAWMHDADLRQHLVLLEPARRNKVLLRPGFQRAVGVVYNPRNDIGNYVPSVLPRRYDAIIYFDQTSPLAPL